MLKLFQRPVPPLPGFLFIVAERLVITGCYSRVPQPFCLWLRGSFPHIAWRHWSIAWRWGRVSAAIAAQK